MTVNIALITSDKAVHASDRRLVRISGNGKIDLYDDDRNKTIVVDGGIFRFCVSYAGLAEAPFHGFNTCRFDVWVARCFASLLCETTELPGLFYRFAEELGNEFANIKLGNRPEFKGTVVLCSGWCIPGPTFSVRIGNYDRLTGKPFENYDRFHVRVDFLRVLRKRRRPRGVFICVMGGIDNAAIYQTFWKDFLQRRRSRFFYRVSDGLISRTLAGYVRQIAEAPGSRGIVGRKCLTVVLHQAPVNHFGGTFEYHTEEATQMHYGPHFVCPGSVAENFRVTYHNS